MVTPGELTMGFGIYVPSKASQDQYPITRIDPAEIPNFPAQSYVGTSAAQYVPRYVRQRDRPASRYRGVTVEESASSATQ